MNSQHKNNNPEQIAGFRVGDKVITPLGRKAEIVQCRIDGYLDARYLDWFGRDADPILQPNSLKRAS
jgi:hypothetical protein